MRLLEPAVHPPGVARPDPADGRRRDAPLEEPYAGVERGLASADDHEAVGALVEAGDLARGHAANAVGHREGWRARRRDGALEVGRIDQLAADAHLPRGAGEPGDEAMLAHVVATREIPDAAGGEEVAVHDPLEIGP